MKADSFEANNQKIVFRGAERWTNLAGGLGMICLGIGCMVAALTGLALFGGIGLWNLWLAIRNWGRPYIRFDGDTLVIHDPLKSQYLHRNSIGSLAGKKFWTVLKMNDGSTVRVSHLPFTNSREVRVFQNQLNRFLEMEETT